MIGALTMKKFNEYTLGIILSIAGIIASIAIVVLKMISKDNVAIGIVLLVACICSLVVNIKQKKEKSE
jgi:heme/copper-type cytochrome/quinol oxidase subunit 4